MLILLFTLLLLSMAQAQRVDVQKTWFGYQFTQNGKVLSYAQLQQLAQTNTDAVRRLKKAKKNSRFASVLTLAGLSCIGVSVGQKIKGQATNWTWTLAGATTLSAAIPFHVRANRQSHAAIRLYNESPIMLEKTNPVAYVRVSAQGLKFGVFVGF